MRLTLFVLIAVVVVASFYVDYRWKKWMAEKSRAREPDGE
jgi:hypothetical protein